jgi:hypothetical protein
MIANLSFIFVRSDVVCVVGGDVCVGVVIGTTGEIIYRG